MPTEAIAKKTKEKILKETKTTIEKLAAFYKIVITCIALLKKNNIAAFRKEIVAADVSANSFFFAFAADINKLAGNVTGFDSLEYNKLREALEVYVSKVKEFLAEALSSAETNPKRTLSLLTSVEDYIGHLKRLVKRIAMLRVKYLV